MIGLPTAPGRQHDQVGLQPLAASSADGARAAAGELHAVDRHLGAQLEVRPLQRRHQVRDRRAHAHAVDLVDGQRAGADRAGRAEVLHARVAGLLAGVDERVHDRAQARRP